MKNCREFQQTSVKRVCGGRSYTLTGAQRLSLKSKGICELFWGFFCVCMVCTIQPTADGAGHILLYNVNNGGKINIAHSNMK